MNREQIVGAGLATAASVLTVATTVWVSLVLSGSAKLGAIVLLLPFSLLLPVLTSTDGPKDSDPHGVQFFQVLGSSSRFTFDLPGTNLPGRTLVLTYCAGVAILSFVVFFAVP